ncbi:MAG: FtsX-like permease family protein [Hydrogenophaga sp.]|uniref:ABC transporter permease n=1 Tax=Hydrogenophaga sp. TaxID=1904254 RepID=UPI002731AA4B|nr:ABC transporter permease [Hydrogenophaga sp.]MDP2163071.1 FtsX-like permease family protein [Hydrogenophaga sp.]MDP3477465.1 FtsX-like permease family protein [Hydrogenophaga sp.]
MKALHHKLWRDFWQLRGQSLAIALVVVGGIATMVMAVTNHQALSDTRARFYETYRFADVFAQLKRAPLPLLHEVRTLPGVAQVQARIVAGVNLEVDGYHQAVTAQVVSLPEPGDDDLNQIYLREGRLPERAWEVVVGEAFAQAHGLHPGDGLTAIVNGRRQRLTLSGVGLSPEFIYQIRAGDVFPDFERFAIVWMRREALASAFDLDGAFNQLSIRLQSDAAAHTVIDPLDRLLKPYGGLGAHGRDLQMSNRFLDEELKQLNTMARLFSGIFLGVSAFLLSVVISRLIGTQREQIAVLKAFGYSRWEVGLHYAQLVLLMVGVGVLPGLALGAWMGRGMADLYMRFYRFPFLEWSVEPMVWAMAVGFAVAAAGLGTAQGLLRAFRLSPAEAMRPEAPAVYRRTLTERMGAGQLLDAAARMVVRNLERRPLRSLMSIVGMGMACGILVMSNLQRDAIEEMIAVQFGLAQRDDLTVTLAEPASARTINELRSITGVQSVEGFRASAVKLRHGHRSYNTALQGLSESADLKRVLDASLQPVRVPAEGLLLTDYLAELLAVRPGDLLDVEFLDGRRETLQLPLAATVTEYLGVGAYTDRNWLNRLRQDGDLVSGAWLKVPAESRPAVVSALRERPRIVAVSDRNASIASFRDTMAENILTFTLIATLMAASMAAGVVYNAARITLAERSRDLASLRILGYTRREVRALLLGELGTLTLLALVPGFAMGYGMSALLVWGMQSDLYRIPLVLLPSGFAMAGAVLLVAAGLSAWLVLRRLDQLDLVAVLKTRE